MTKYLELILKGPTTYIALSLRNNLVCVFWQKYTFLDRGCVCHLRGGKVQVMSKRISKHF